MRAYLAVDVAALRELERTGALPAGRYETRLPADADEESEHDAMAEAAQLARRAYGRHLVVAVDVDDPADAVPLSQVAAIHVGEDLAWYATQELPAAIAAADAQPA